MYKKIAIPILFLLVLYSFVACNKKSFNISEGYLQELTEVELDNMFDNYKALKLQYSNDYVAKTVNIDTKSIGGLVCRDNDVIIADRDYDRLIVMDYNNKIIKTVGKLGSGNLKISKPTDVAVSNDKIFVLESDNKRVQILDKNFNFLENISYEPVLESFDKRAFISDIEVDKDENIYLSSVNGEYSKIMVYVASRKEFKELGNNFYGSLAKYKDEVFAISEATKKVGEKGTYVGVQTGYNYIFKLNPNKMTLLGGLYLGLMPSGVVKTDEGLYCVSHVYKCLMYFDNDLNYKYSLLKTEDSSFHSYLAKSEKYGFYLTFPDNNEIINIRKKER
jgi:hypothetical protein